MKNSPQKQKTHEIIEHTADIGIRSFGANMPELFCHAAEGMFSLIGSLRSKDPPVLATETIEIQAGDREELLVGWLSELLSLTDVRGWMLVKARIEELCESRLSAVVSFAEKTTKRYKFHHDIKAVTYYNVSIREERGRLQADIYFDV